MDSRKRNKTVMRVEALDGRAIPGAVTAVAITGSALLAHAGSLTILPMAPTAPKLVVTGLTVPLGPRAIMPE